MVDVSRLHTEYSKVTMIRLKKIQQLTALTLAVAIELLPLSPAVRPALAASLTGSNVSISDSRPSGTSVSYDIQFDNVTTSTIKCIQVVFSDAASGGSVPTGFSSTSAALSGSSDFIPTPGSWTVNATSNGTVKITYTTGETPASSTDRDVILTGITNGSTAETGYFVQLSTYNNTDCSSSAVDSGVGTFIYATGQTVSLTVDPTISLDIAAVSSGQSVNGATTTVTTTDGTIPFGTVTTGALSIAAHDATITTNAGSGYSLYIRYTAKPTSGSNDIDDWTGTNGSPTAMSAGTEAFGYTTNDSTLSVTGDGAARFTTSGPKYAGFTTTNAEVGYSSAAVSSQTIRLGYAVGISGTTPAGTYGNSTVIITATPAY